MKRRHQWLWLTGVFAALGWSAAVGGPFDRHEQAPDRDSHPFAQPKEAPKAAAPKKKPRSGREGDLLTPEQINRIRYMELRAMRLDPATRPDPVRVDIPQATIDEFLDAIKDNQNYRGDRTRREFMKLTPPQKLHQIAVYEGAKFADKVTIKSDPEVFVTFKKKVLPIVLRTCATAGCHAVGTDEDVGFRLHPDSKRTPATVYTNFLTLDRARVDDRAVIDRDKPEESLLLSCMLPLDEVPARLRHPGNAKYHTSIGTRSSTAYRNILSWIKSLKHPIEDYGIDWGGEPEAEENKPATSAPAEKPKPDAPMR